MSLPAGVYIIVARLTEFPSNDVDVKIWTDNAGNWPSRINRGSNTVTGIFTFSAPASVQTVAVSRVGRDLTFTSLDPRFNEIIAVQLL